MKYLMNILELNHWIEIKSFGFNVLMIFLVFVLTYRWGLNFRIRMNLFKGKKIKILYCDTCFGFWLCLLLSTNLVTAATAFLIYSFYEKN